MIFYQRSPVAITQFPDGSSSIRVLVPTLTQNHYITWKYDGDHECMAIWHLVHHIRDHCPDAKIILDMPYLPNARMDRVKNPDEVFTLKWFSLFINKLNFYCVNIVDPHSNVGAALIDRVHTFGINVNVSRALCDIGAQEEMHPDNIILCYPDEGACKKYSEQLNSIQYIFGIKHRDWRTGQIESLELNNPSIAKGKTVLIVDDICSRGGTFMHTAHVLKNAGANNIYLYVTHCENTIFKGDLIDSPLIEGIYTTGSIYRGNHSKIKVINEVRSMK